MQQFSKRLCAILLVLCAVMAFLPMTSQAAVVNSADYIQQSLTLADDLVLNLYSLTSKLENYKDKGYATITAPAGMDGKTVTNEYTVEDLTTVTTSSGDNMYHLPVDRVIAQMADEIELVVKSNTGVEVLKQTYTVRDYLTYLLDGIYTKDLKNLAFELLNYGAAAQEYFNYNTGNLANEDYEKAPGYAMPADKPTISVADNLDNVSFYGTTLVFLSQTSIRFYFDVDDSVKNYTFTVDGVTKNAKSKSGLYYIEVADITPQNMDKALNVVVKDSNNNELSFSYKPQDYLVRSYHNTDNAQYQNLLHTAYSYYCAAENYAGTSFDTSNKLDLVSISGDQSSISVVTDLTYDSAMTTATSSTGSWNTGIDQTQQPNSVAVANSDNKAKLTFNFATKFEVGDTFSLPKGMGIILNGQEYILNEDYMFQLAMSGESSYLWNVIEPDNGESILGFENYTQITEEAMLYMSNNLGVMKVNTDPRYVSEGVGSLKVMPQGDYSISGKHPYIKIDVSGDKVTSGTEGDDGKTIADITHDDFSSYRSLSFDAFNPESEDLQVRVSLVMLSGDSYITTPKKTYTLESGMWTSCIYDLSIMGGFSDIYDMDGVRFVVFEFLDHKETRDGEAPTLYIDDLVAHKYLDGESAVDTVVNYTTGVDFESTGAEYLFTGQGNPEQDAAVERVSYADAGITADSEKYGSYALKLSTDDDLYPPFRIHFDQELPAGAAVYFDAYAVVTGDNQYNQSIFEFSNGNGEATEQFSCGMWTNLSFTLPEDGSYVDLFWNIDRASFTTDEHGGEVYIDNIRIETNITAKGNILDGLLMEEIGNVAYFSSDSSTVKRASYASLGISACDGGNNNALSVSQSGETATVTIDFNQTLPSGTKITFFAYGTHDGGTFSSSRKLSASTGTLSNTEPAYDTWTEITLTLTSDATAVTLTWNANYWWGVNSTTLILDNVKAVTPAVDPEGSWISGLDFETAGNAGYFTAIGENNYQDFSIRRVAYTEMAEYGIPAPADGGSYALKLTHSYHQYPTFRISNDTASNLKAGDVISFQIYVEIEDVGTNSTKFEFNNATIGVSGDATTTFTCGTWHTLTVTLPDTFATYGHTDLFLNVDHATGAQNRTSTVYIDNMVVVNGSFTDGVTFEDTDAVSSEMGLVLGQGVENDGTLARVSYADLSIGTPGNSGSYALKLSTDNDKRWPTFRLNFGKTLPAGTLITFDAYGMITNGENSYNQSIFEFSNGGEATKQFTNGAWTSLYIVLYEDAAYLDLFWNVDRAGFADGVTDAAAEVYMDNFLATVPESTASGNMADNTVGFENSGESALITGQGVESMDMAITRIPYSLVGVDASSISGGDYAVRVGHKTSPYPTFRINFGKTLEAGTTITFDVYGDYTAESVKEYKYYKLCLSASSVTYGAGNNADAPEQLAWTLVQSWTEASVTLTAACDYLDIYVNIGEATDEATTASYVLLDNFYAAEPVEVSGDIMEGYGFEDAGNALRFTDVDGGTNAVRKRVSYASANITAPTNGGDYALMLTHDSFCWPTFRLDFGTTLEAGMVITFDAYIGSGNMTQSGKSVKIELTGDSTANASGTDGTNYVFAATHDTWATATIVLENACSYLDMFYNIGELTGDQDGSSYCYIDNIQAHVTEAADFEAGVTFEVRGHENSFTATGGSNDATIERVSYADTDIPVLTNGGDYALKLTHASFCWPTFRINFGKTLPAGTVITFDALGGSENADEYTGLKIELSGDESKANANGTDGSNEVFTADCDAWATATIVLENACSYLDLFYNIDAIVEAESATSYFYMDNFLAVEPEDIYTGVGFEVQSSTDFITGVGGNETWRDMSPVRVSYADAGIAAPENGGSYAVKLTSTDSQWPTFKIDFGQTLTAGTVITFDAYSACTEGLAANANTLVVWLGDDNSTDSKNDDDIELKNAYGSWTTLSLTLTSDSDSVSFYWNMDQSNEGITLANYALYLDNIQAHVTEAADFEAGVTFEVLGHENSFTGTDNTEDATIERVSYSDLGISVPSNGGEYALKLTGSTSYPRFRINFGKTLPAGTTITCDSYAFVDGTASAVVMMYEDYGWGDAQAVYMGIAGWRDDYTWDTTLPEDCDHIDIVWELRDADTSNSVIIIDNIKVVQPENEAADFEAGVTFETAGHEASFTGTGTNDATITRVSYADLSVSNSDGTTDGHALMLSHETFCWPTFRMNFGKTLPAGTTITFDTYGNFNYEVAEGIYKIMKVELTSDAKSYAESGENQVIYTVTETWSPAEKNVITLTADSDHLDLMYNVNDGSYGEVASWLLIDNIVATVPDMSFLNGVTFEEESHASLFVADPDYTNNPTMTRVSYSDAGISGPSNGGSYALKLTSENDWPWFRINFGRTLSAGTVINFKAYVACSNTSLDTSVAILEHQDGLLNSSSGDAIPQFYYNTWTELSMTLASDTSFVDLCWTMDRWNKGYSPSDFALYLDNFYAITEIPSALSFELAYNANFFGATGGSNDATIERVSYADLGIGQPSDSGEYALKLSHTSSAWPTFRINFGKTLAAGSKIKFDYYITHNNTATDASLCYASNGEQAAYWPINSWIEDNANFNYVTLTEDCSYIDLFWNVERGTGVESGITSYVIFDNIEIIEAS